MTSDAAFDGRAASLLAAASELDATDPLAEFVERFEPAPGVDAYLDGNSLGRPVRGVGDEIARFVAGDWGIRLIRSWDEGWMQLPFEVGDRIGRVALGAAPGQTVVADSTTVLLYKLVAAAVRGVPAGGRILIERGNFPTDRFIVDALATTHGLIVDWLDPDPIDGVTADEVSAALSDRTALVVLSHVDYRSGALADMAEITSVVRDAGAVMLWDLCHSAGVVPMRLDEWGVDLAVGCSYKYLNGGPGAPAFAYVREGLHDRIEQPIPGWMGAADVFAMGPAYRPAAGMRRLLSGTPPVVGMLPMQAMLDLLERAGVDAVREKSRTLTALAIRAYDEVLAGEGVDLLTTRDADRRGSHVLFGHPSFRTVTDRLWADGVIPDFREPRGIRIGLSPLSTTHREAVRGVLAIAAALPG